MVVGYVVRWPSRHSIVSVPAARSAWIRAGSSKSAWPDGTRRAASAAAGTSVLRWHRPCMCDPRPDDPRDRRPVEALRRGRGARRGRILRRARRDLRLPRRQRRGQDDDDADRPRHPARRQRDASPGGAGQAPSSPRRTFGYLPEERGLYPRMRVLDQLVFFAGLYGVPERRAPGATPSAGSNASGSPSLAGRRADELSKGNQQKIQFIAAILHDPEVVLMDEPFTGLDPVNVALLRAAFARAGRAGPDADLLDPPDGGRRVAGRRRSRSSTTAGWSPAARPARFAGGPAGRSSGWPSRAIAELAWAAGPARGAGEPGRAPTSPS